MVTLYDEIFGEESKKNTDIAMQGYAIKELPVWLFDKKALRVQPEPVYRMDLRDKRYYYKFLDELKTIPQFYISVTSSIASLDLLPSSEGLYKYYNSFSTMEEAKKDMQKKADYGTFIHILIAKFLRDRELMLDSIWALVNEYKSKNDLEYNNSWWINRAKKDLVAVDVWLKEYEVKPIASELVLTSEMGFASAIDLVCEMTIGTGANGKILKKDLNNGSCQRIVAVIDWKSGNGFYESHAYQLEAYRRLINEHYPDLQIEKLYNISPKGETSLSCEMKDQTGIANREVELPDGSKTTLFDAYWSIFKTKFPNYNNPRDIQDITGAVSLDYRESYKIGGIDPRELVIQKHRGAYA